MFGKINQLIEKEEQTKAQIRLVGISKIDLDTERLNAEWGS